MAQMNALTLFDYKALDAETRIVVQQRTSEIKTLMRRTAQDILDIGEKLTEVKARLGHGRFGGWLEAEFNWEERTARRFMMVYAQFKTDNLSDLNIAPSALYLLAAPSTPDEAREEVLEMAHAGQPVGYTEAKRIVAGHKLSINSHRSGVRTSSEGVEPDLDEDGQPLVSRMDSAINERFAEQVDLDDEDDEIATNTMVRYRGAQWRVIGRSGAGLALKDGLGRMEIGIDPADVQRVSEVRQTVKEALLAATQDIPVVDGMKISESHPVGFAGLYATPEAMGYGQAICSACGETSNAWKAIPAGRWRCGRCRETTNDDAMQIVGKDEYDLEQRMAKHRRAANGSNQKPAPAPVDDASPRHTAQSGHYSSESAEWYTPPEIAKLVRQVMPIDLDPASCYHAQQVIKAKYYFDAQMDGLHPERKWNGRVFLNPPYGREIGKWTERLIAEYCAAHTTEAILLVPARPDTEWFGLLRDYPRCFVTGRLKFWNGEHLLDAQEAAPFPSAVFYLGNRLDAFAEAFTTIGDIYTLWKPSPPSATFTPCGSPPDE